MSLIELKHVDVFQSDRLILSDVSFSIQSTEFVYLIGATGSGKSSLLKTLYAELPMKKGLGEVVDHQLFEIKKSMVINIESCFFHDASFCSLIIP